MSRGKYSPWCYNNRQKDTEYIYNCYGEVPAIWDKDNYDEKLMFEFYDSQGFDSYGYSAFDGDGKYVGICSGIDRYGYTENDYRSMSDDKFQDVSAYAKEVIVFKRNRDIEVKLTENSDIIQTSQTKGNVMELCEVKAAFDALENNDFVFTDGFSKPHSYRGYYNQVAFEPTKFVSLVEIKLSLNAALHDTFVAWKGGEYEYDEHTLVNLSFPGMCNNDAAERFEKLVSIMLNEYFDADQTVDPKKKRKTKAQKQAEAAIARRDEQKKEWEEFCKDYPNRFAALMFDYFNFGQTDCNLSIAKVDNGYEFCSGTGWNRVGFVLTPIPPKEYSWKYMQSLREAESPIEEERERIKEAMRKQQLRETALSKLTDEEKEALGYN